MEKTICPQPRLKFILNSIKKYACTNETAAHNLCNDRLGVLCKGLSLNCSSRSLVTKPRGLFKRSGRVPKSFFYEKPNKNVFFSKCFSKYSVETCWWSFFVLRNADFFTFKNASEVSWGNVLLIRVWYSKQVMRLCWSDTLTYCYRLFGLSAFSNRHAVLRKLQVWWQKRKFWTVVNRFFLRFRFGGRKEILRDRLEEFERPFSIDVISGHYILRNRWRNLRDGFGPSKHLKKTLVVNISST